jgi:uncharacterized protein DUF6838
MNKGIETAIISNLQSKFPSSRIFTGLVIEGVQATDIILNCIYDEIFLARGHRYYERHSIIKVTYLSPDDNTRDNLIACLQIFTDNGNSFYPTSLEVEEVDDTMQVMIDLQHLERSS